MGAVEKKTTVRKRPGSPPVPDLPKGVEPLTLELLMKLGSIVVHADEYLSDDGHDFDLTALRTLMADPQVVAWVQSMSRLGLLPVPRKLRRAPWPK